VLRARASRFGIDLSPAGEVDLVAAVIGADLWLLVNRAVDLDHASGLQPGAAEALSKVLLRAAGRPSPVAVWKGPPAPCSTSTPVVAAVAAYLEWAQEHVRVEASDALRRAAQDLYCGSLASTAEVLIVAAEASELLRPPN
jgi:hypothetical protein